MRRIPMLTCRGPLLPPPWTAAVPPVCPPPGGGGSNWGRGSRSLPDFRPREGEEEKRRFIFIRYSYKILPISFITI